MHTVRYTELTPERFKNFWRIDLYENKMPRYAPGGRRGGSAKADGAIVRGHLKCLAPLNIEVTEARVVVGVGLLLESISVLRKFLGHYRANDAFAIREIKHLVEWAGGELPDFFERLVIREHRKSLAPLVIGTVATSFEAVTLLVEVAHAGLYALRAAWPRSLGHLDSSSIEDDSCFCCPCVASTQLPIGNDV